MRQSRKPLYEGMYILSATLSEEARQRALDKIVSGIAARQGDVHKVFEQGRKRFAYEMQGKREGYYYVLYFSMPSTALSDMSKECHLNEDLVRFMTLRAEAVPDKLEFKPLVQE